jgi:serine/threonine protein kinase
MGVVYLAQNNLMGRLEVLKVVSGHLVNRRGVIDRFFAEIRNAAKLHHPNIVTAYSVLRLGESIALAMEYVEGLDLSRLVRAKGPLPVAKACNYMHQAALGLQHANEHGMVHRDIKSSNLMLTAQGGRALIKVLDFGLAKIRSEGPVEGGLTNEGQMLGTPHYIAPEQTLDARKADIRADIYSLGCTFYYLLTGEPPFDGTSLYDILQAHHSREALPLNLARPEIPAEVAAIVAKMMAKERERRFQEPKEVAQALKPYFKAASVPAMGSKPDVSRATRPETTGGTAGADPVPLRTAAGPGPVIAASAGTIATQPPLEPMWDSLVDLKETASSPDPAPAIAPNRRLPWLWPVAAVGVLLLGFIAMWGTVVLKIKTPEGYIVLRDLPDEATVLIDGKKATVHWPDGGSPAEITVVPGEHLVQVKKDGFNTTGQAVKVETGGRTSLMVQLEPLIPRPAGGAASDHPSRPETEKAPPSIGIPEKLAGTLNSSHVVERELNPFNGRNFEGWHGFYGTGIRTPSEIFRVEEDEIVWNGQQGRILINESLCNFSFNFEYLLPLNGRYGTTFCVLDLTEGDPYQVNGMSYRVGTVGCALSDFAKGNTGSIVINSGSSDFAVGRNSPGSGFPRGSEAVALGGRDQRPQFPPPEPPTPFPLPCSARTILQVPRHLWPIDPGEQPGHARYRPLLTAPGPGEALEGPEHLSRPPAALHRYPACPSS